MTVRELVGRYMADYKGRDTTRAQRLTWWCARLGDVRLADVTDDEIFFALEDLAAQASRYFAGIDADGRPIYKAKKRPLAPATLNRYAAAIGAVFTWAIRRRLTPRDWTSPNRRIERRPENNDRVRFLSDLERERLLAACRASKWKRLYLLVLLAITTGARRGELLGLRWRDVDFARALAYVRHTKNGEPRTLPLVAPVLEELRRFAAAPGSLVFASARRPDVPFSFESAWARALKDAGVKDFRFHDCRHSCASYLAQAGATLLEIGDVLGHRQVSVTKRYSHLTVGHKAALVARVLGEIR